MTRRTLALAAVGAALWIPLVWTVLAACGVTPDNNASPPSWTVRPTIDHFLEIGVAEPAFWQELATSTAMSLGATLLTIGVAFMAAYSLARSRSRGVKLVAPVLLVLASLPAMAYVIPLSDLWRRAHLVDTFGGVLLAQAASTAPLATFVLFGAISQLPVDSEEAAVLDGAPLSRVLLQVVVPSVLPTLAAAAIVIFVLDWNMLLVPLVLTGGEVKTVPVAMSDFFTFERELEWPTAAAALVVSVLPVAVLVAIFHRLLERFRLREPEP